MRFDSLVFRRSLRSSPPCPIERCKSAPALGGRGDAADGAKAGSTGFERTESILAALHRRAGEGVDRRAR